MTQGKKKFVKRQFYVCEHCDSDMVFFRTNNYKQPYCLACNAPTKIVSKEFKIPNLKLSPVVEYNPRYGRED